MFCKYCGGPLLFDRCQGCGQLKPKVKKTKKRASLSGWLVIIGIIGFLAALQWTVNFINRLFH